ncbi:MAG TPA: peptidase M16, partial [Gammaproteobacteria bacterium]|nr:peptidase M16 [Gammaproteobacteria bacterium]
TDFNQSIDWCLNEKHKQEKVEEAILGIISHLDKPHSPSDEADRAFFNNLYGKTTELRQQFRQRVLAVNTDDLVRVTQTYLQKDKASVAAITNQETLKAVGDLGMNVEKI